MPSSPPGGCSARRVRLCRDSRRAGGPAFAAGAPRPSEDLLHDETPFHLDVAVEVRDQALKRVAALEERLELEERVPRRVAVEAHRLAGRGPEEDVEPLGAWVLLH